MTPWLLHHDKGHDRIALKSLNEGIDTGTSSGRFLFHVLGALAQVERQILIERTRAGLAASRACGKVGGRPRSKDDAKIRAAKAMLATDKMTVAEIAVQVGCSISSLYRHVTGGRKVVQTVAAVTKRSIEKP